MGLKIQDPAGRAAFLFPGQGAQCANMLEPFREAPNFKRRYQAVCATLDADPLEEIQRDPDYLNRNAVSSLLAVLASVLALELMPDIKPIAAAGYSVGQWVALYASRALSLSDLFQIVYQRALLMDACLDTGEPTGMLAVIGIRQPDILQVCERAAALDMPLQITNDNAPGQVTLGGTVKAIEFAEAQLRPLRPKRIHRVPAAGAWHSGVLNAAVPKLAKLLAQIRISPRRIPVIDNTTGSWLPEEDEAMIAALARQVAMPVLWQQGIRTLAAAGVTDFIEAGYGDTLTKFGSFIVRPGRHVAVAAARASVN